MLLRIRASGLQCALVHLLIVCFLTYLLPLEQTRSVSRPEVVRSDLVSDLVLVFFLFICVVDTRQCRRRHYVFTLSRSFVRAVRYCRTVARCLMMNGLNNIDKTDRKYSPAG